MNPKSRTTGRNPLLHRDPTGRPTHLQSTRARARRCERLARGVPREVSPPSRDLRHLHGHRVGSTTPSKTEHRPEGLGVGSLSLQEHRHPPALGLVAIHPGRCIEVIHHHIKVAVIVEVAQGHAVADPIEIKPPGSTQILHHRQAIHAESAAIAKSPQGHRQPREPLTLPEQLGIGP